MSSSAVKERIILLSSIVLIAAHMISCQEEAASKLTATYEVGEVTRVEDVYGTFFVYVPELTASKPDILVLIHGTPAKTETAEQTASYYIANWLEFGREQGLVLIAPAFSHENFSSRKGELQDMMTGYRGLFGREIGADYWVLRIVGAYQEALGSKDGRFSLYGHSAGGQFVGRFLVTHPDLVRSAVITAAVTYPQPDPDVAWPYGLGELHTEIRWDEDTIRREDIVPDVHDWLAATQIPVIVTVGMNDSAGQLQRPGQKGTNRITIAKNWVQDMKHFAQEHGLECDYKFVVIPGKGHSMSGLVPFSQAALLELEPRAG